VKVTLFATHDWSLYNYRLPLARRLRAAGCEVVMISQPGPFVEEIEAAGFRFAGVPVARGFAGPLAEARTLRALARRYREERPDVAHHFNMKGVLYGAVAARWTGVPGVVHSITGMGRGFYRDDWKARLLRVPLLAWHRLAFAGAQVIFQNPDDRAYCLDRNLTTEAGSRLVRGSGVDTDRFAPTPEPEEGPPQVVMAARMIETKGVRVFVEAARRLRDEGVPARFVLVGDSDEEDRAAVPRAELRAWDREGLAAWHGYRDDMNAVLAESHVCCLPSHHREGLPRVLLEAGACARPVVTTDHRGCREAVRSGENGLIVPARDPGALACALGRLVEDGSLRRKMGRRGRELVEKHFSMRHVAEETLAAYHASLRRQPA